MENNDERKAFEKYYGAPLWEDKDAFTMAQYTAWTAWQARAAQDMSAKLAEALRVLLGQVNKEAHFFPEVIHEYSAIGICLKALSEYDTANGEAHASGRE